MYRVVHFTSVDPGGGDGVRGAGSAAAREGGRYGRRGRSELALRFRSHHRLLLREVEIQGTVHA